MLWPPPHSFSYSHRVNHGTNTFHILAEYFTSYLFSRRCFRCFYFLYFSSSRSNKAIFCYLLFFFACCFEIFNEIHVWFFIFCFRSPFFFVSSRCTSIATKLFVKIKRVHTYHAHWLYYFNGELLKYFPLRYNELLSSFVFLFSSKTIVEIFWFFQNFNFDIAYVFGQLVPVGKSSKKKINKILCYCFVLMNAVCTVLLIVCATRSKI